MPKIKKTMRKFLQKFVFISKSSDTQIPLSRMSSQSWKSHHFVNLRFWSSSWESWECWATGGSPEEEPAWPDSRASSCNSPHRCLLCFWSRRAEWASWGNDPGPPVAPLRPGGEDGLQSGQGRRSTAKWQTEMTSFSLIQSKLTLRNLNVLRVECFTFMLDGLMDCWSTSWKEMQMICGCQWSGTDVFLYDDVTTFSPWAKVMTFQSYAD